MLTSYRLTKWQPQDLKSLEVRARKAFEMWESEEGSGKLNKQQTKLALISLLG